jgi:hypothetical protein
MDYLRDLIHLLQVIFRHNLRLALHIRHVALSVVNQILDCYNTL